jgi:hypothetical protein
LTFDPTPPTTVETLTAPAVPAGVTTLMLVAVLLTGIALLAPKLTEDAPAKPVPVMITVVPPAVGPLAGAMLAMNGPYVNWSAALIGLVPPGAVTVTSTGPEPAGDVAVTDVFDTEPGVTQFTPKQTEVAPENPLPVIVIRVPPFAEPEFGETPVTTGTGAE